MVTQTIEIESEYPDEANTTCDAHDKDTRACVQSSAVLAAPDASGVIYLPQFTDLPAGEYLFILKDSSGYKLSYGYATVALQTATYKLSGVPQASQPALATAVASVDTKLGEPAMDSIAEDIAAVKTDTESILTKLGTAFSTLITNLTAMITGTGGTAAWSATAMANAPGGGSSGTGPNEFTLTITDTNGTPLEGVSSRLVADVANDFRANTIANGQALFGLPSLTYTVILSKAGYTFTPVTLAVAASGGQTYQMIPVTITAPTTPGTATGVLIVRDKAQAPLQDVPIHVQLIRGAGAGNAGNSPGAQVWTQTSDASGQVQFVGLLHGGTYRGWRDQDRTNAVEFTVPATASYQLPETIGE